MAKRRRPTPRPEDRHASPFMTRLPEVYRTQLRRLQGLIRARHRFTPPMTAMIQQALEDLLAQYGLWPPSGEATPPPAEGPSGKKRRDPR